ncbi:ABC transporter permease subunit [soil metagenome]
MYRLIKYIILDILRTRFLLFYTLFLILSTIGMFQLDSDTSKVVLSLLNILLIVVPLISVVFTTIHFYNSYEFIELMLAQPINRSLIFLAEYIATALSLSIAFLIGIGLPMLYYNADESSLTLLLAGVLLTFVFVSLAFLASVMTRDKAKAIGFALLFWFYFTLIYDAFILWIIYTFNDYPLEFTTLAMISLNPVDLARIMMILKLDYSALMGYTGAFYKDFLGNNMGYIFSISILCIWIIAPLWIARKVFVKKDL